MQLTHDGILIVGDAPGGNYREKVLTMHDVGLLPTEPGLYHTDIYHDNWCSLFRGGLCDCAPDIVVRKETPCT